MKKLHKTLMLGMVVSTLLSPSAGDCGKQRGDGYWKGERRHDSRDNGNSPSPEQKGEVTVSGVILDEGGTPMEGCKVCFFDSAQGPTPAPESNWWRIPDQEYPGLVDATGSFNATVPEGEYVIASVERLDPNEDFGPPKKGERVYLSGKIDLKGKKTVGLGKGTSHPHRGQKSATDKAKPTSRVEGRLLQSDGRPFAGGFVVAYPYGFLSKRTKADGRFSLHIPEGGNYRLVARNVYGFT